LLAQVTLDPRHDRCPSRSARGSIMRRTISCGFLILLVCGISAVVSLVAASSDRVQSGQEKPSTPVTEAVVTAVTGPSWLNHLGLTYRGTSLGRGSGRYGPNPNEQAPLHEPL